MNPSFDRVGEQPKTDAQHPHVLAYRDAPLGRPDTPRPVKGRRPGVHSQERARKSGEGGTGESVRDEGCQEERTSHNFAGGQVA